MSRFIRSSRKKTIKCNDAEHDQNRNYTARLAELAVNMLGYARRLYTNAVGLVTVTVKCSDSGFPRLFTDTSEHICFYRAMLCIRLLAMALCPSVCPSVRLSVTSRSSTKTAKHRIT